MLAKVNCYNKEYKGVEGTYLHFEMYINPEFIVKARAICFYEGLYYQIYMEDGSDYFVPQSDFDFMETISRRKYEK